MCRVLFKGSEPVSAFSTYPFLYILAIPGVELVRDRSNISLVIILTLGLRSKTPVGFWHFLIFVTFLGCIYHTTCYTDIGIGELVIYFTLQHGSTVYCSWPSPFVFLSWIRIVYFGGYVHTEHGYARLRIFVRI